MVTRTMRLLDHQRRLERAETLLHDLESRLRERPDHEHHALRNSMRLANRDASLARRALMDLITESSVVASETQNSGTRLPTDASSRKVDTLPHYGQAKHSTKAQRRA